GKLADQFGDALRAGAVEHLEHRDRRHDGIVVAAPDRRVEEIVAALLEAGDGAELGRAPLDVGMTGLPVIGDDAVRLQHRIDLIQAGGLYVDDELRVANSLRQIPREQNADLVGEDLVPMIVDDAAAIAIAVKAEREL